MSVLLDKYEDLIICDLAEYYHIYNYEEYNPLYIATLVRGLGGYSRIKRELTGCKYTEQEIIRAKICDSLNWLVWCKTKDAEHNRNKPESLVYKMLGLEDKPKQDFEHDVFDNKDEFIETRKKILERLNNGR